MKEYIVHVEYVTVAELRIKAKDEDWAFDIADEYIGTEAGIAEVMSKLAYNAPEGFEIVEVEEA